MVKFSKELEAQLIPEWKGAFVNYKMLKKHIKKIKLTRVPKKQQAEPQGDFGRTIFDSLRFLITNKLFCSSDNIKQDIIQVPQLLSLYICNDLKQSLSLCVLCAFWFITFLICWLSLFFLFYNLRCFRDRQTSNMMLRVSVIFCVFVLQCVFFFRVFLHRKKRLKKLYHFEHNENASENSETFLPITLFFSDSTCFFFFECSVHMITTPFFQFCTS